MLSTVRISGSSSVMRPGSALRRRKNAPRDVSGTLIRASSVKSTNANPSAMPSPLRKCANAFGACEAVAAIASRSTPKRIAG